MKDQNIKDKQSPESKKKLTILLYSLAFLPLFIITCLLIFQSDDDMPSVEMLDNPPEMLASIIYAGDGETELGRYWQVNRSSISYDKISPYVIDALISTEDERFLEHSGVDFKGLTRAIVYMGSKGGASTITQQLAKQLFTLKQREDQQQARQNGTEMPGANRGKVGRLMHRVNEKAQENIIATRLEKRYTKEEIVTMYLNQFDFLYNAVGIANAAKVYFNKEAKDLDKNEAAMLVGMCKNPSLYNPHTYKIKNYRLSLALRKKVKPSEISVAEIQEARSQDSLLAQDRKNQVLFQWLRNSEKNRKGLRNKINKTEYEALKITPVLTTYQPVDHKKGIAPYFRETLRKDVTNILNETDENGNLKIKNKDGVAYNIYKDGLKIYTTIDVKMQQYAEWALQEHLKKELQASFDKNNKNLKFYPYMGTPKTPMTEERYLKNMQIARKSTERYATLKDADLSESEIEKIFNEPVAMSVFSWKGEVDTILSPNDSIRYYKSFLHAGLLSLDPHTGFIKAWVGGADFDNFAYDHVSTGRRQVGSTIKPFVYGTAISMGTVKPCTTFPAGPYCVGNWCPAGSAAGNVAAGLAASSNPTTVAVMASMGPSAGAKNISQLLKNMDIVLRKEDEVPPMCLGIMSLSLIEIVSAQAMLVNDGIFTKPTAILRIEDRSGNVIYSAEPKMKEVMNPNVAYCVLYMMKGVVNGGTASRLRYNRPYGNIKVPMAGKTGTTQGNSDGWFMGLTPDLVTGVWVGAEEMSIRFRSTNLGQGANTGLPIYGYFMNKVYADPSIKISKEDFPVPLGYDPENFSCSQDNLLNNIGINPFL